MSVMPGAEDNAAIVPRFVEEMWNWGNLNVLDELLAPDAVAHSADPAAPALVGIRAQKQFVGLFRAAFPDFRVTADELFAQGDTVVVRYTGSGTHLGAFVGRPPTGRRVTIPVVVVDHLAGGKITEARSYSDAVALPRQLGA